MKNGVLAISFACAVLFALVSCDNSDAPDSKNKEEQKSDVASKIAQETEEFLGENFGEKKYPELEVELDYNTDPEKDYLVTIKTEFGDIQLVLYDETLNHKKNFIKLASLGFYDNTSFHRVLNEFMIQGGDPNSKEGVSSTWGMGGPGYTIPAEFNPKYIHKKGAIAAARTGGNSNPEKESSGSQFYIVHGKTYTEEELKEIENSRIMNINQAVSIILYKPENKISLAKAIDFQQQNNKSKVDSILAVFMPEAEKLVESSKVVYSPEQRKVYKEIGGAPFLDMDYTVFGEVVDGLDVVDKIAGLKVGGSTNSLPLKKVVVTVEVELLNKKKIRRMTGYKF